MEVYVVLDSVSETIIEIFTDEILAEKFCAPFDNLKVKAFTISGKVPVNPLFECKYTDSEIEITELTNYESLGFSSIVSGKEITYLRLVCRAIDESAARAKLNRLLQGVI
jgi:hypothetical protein